VNYGLRLGYKADGTPRIYKGDAHILTVAPTRAGKGRDLLIPALLSYEGSALVVDPKGQLAAITARQRQRMGQRVVMLNPFRLWPKYADGSPCLERFEHVTFNPMAALEAENLASDCKSIAEAIVLDDSGGEGKFWNDSARQLVVGMMMYLWRTGGREKKNLVSLYDMMQAPAVYAHARQALDQLDADPLITARLSRFAIDPEKDEPKSVGDIVSTAVTQCDFMGEEAIRESLKSAPGNELRFRDLRRKPMTVYLILPTEYLASCSKWFRLAIEAALFDLLHDYSRPGAGAGIPVLMVMDEFAQLKRLQIIEEALAGAAGYGVMLWPVLQDLNQLKELYKDRWETFIGNAGISTWYPPKELTTSEYVSKLCGETEAGFEKKTIGQNPFDEDPEKRMGVNIGWERVARPLFLPEEVRGFGANGLCQDEMLIFATGMTKVIRGKRVPYFKDPDFAGLYDPDPYRQQPERPIETENRVPVVKSRR
jgi:type IV secretion system protein VirD4